MESTAERRRIIGSLSKEQIMKRTTKLALVAGVAAAIALAGATVSAHPEGGWGGDFGYGMGPGYHMGYGMMGGYGGYGMGPGMMGGYGGYGMGPGGHMGYGFGPGGGHMGYGYGTGLNGVLHGFPGTVDEQLADLKSTLGVTDSQQAAWQGFAEAVKKGAEHRLAWFDKMHGTQAPRTTPEWFAQRDEAVKQRQADNEAVTGALTKLYDALTPDQRTLLDRGSIAQGPRYGRR
jgi:hypothetical protein